MPKSEFLKKHPRISSFLFDQEKLHYRFFLIAAVILSVAIPYILISEKRKNQAYKKSKFTYGIIQEIVDSHGKGGPSHEITFSFKNETNKTFLITDYDVGHPCLDYRKIGDTIIIEYSLTDEDYARIESCYWNETLKREYGFVKK